MLECLERDLTRRVEVCWSVAARVPRPFFCDKERSGNFGVQLACRECPAEAEHLYLREPVFWKDRDFSERPKDVFVLESRRRLDDEVLIAGLFIASDRYVRFASLFLGGASESLCVFLTRRLSMRLVLCRAPVVQTESSTVLRVRAGCARARAVPRQRSASAVSFSVIKRLIIRRDAPVFEPGHAFGCCPPRTMHRLLGVHCYIMH